MGYASVGRLLSDELESVRERPLRPNGLSVEGL